MKSKDRVRNIGNIKIRSIKGGANMVMRVIFRTGFGYNSDNWIIMNHLPDV